MKPFPKTLYVRQDEDGDDTYFVCFDDLADAIDEDGTTIASYTLASKDKGRVRKDLVPR